jgi:hypothetical protein
MPKLGRQELALVVRPDGHLHAVVPLNNSAAEVLAAIKAVLPTRARQPSSV